MSKHTLAIVAIACFGLSGTAVAQLATAPVYFKPDPVMTPGDVDPNVTQANIATTICRQGGYTSSVRNVPASEKTAVFQEYKIPSIAGLTKGGNKKVVWVGGPYEIDHLVSLELGGTNNIKNLWPQSYVSQPLNAHIKDALEDHLHMLVCHGTVPLAQAQHDIETDWPSAYKKYMPLD